TEVRSFDIFANDPRKIGLDKQVAAILPLMPLPNNFDTGDGLNTGGFRFNVPTPSKNNQWTAKIDHNLSSDHRLYYRISRFNTFSYDALNNVDSTFPGQPTGTQGGIRWGYAAGSNWVLRPWLVNEFLIGYQSSNVDFQRPRPRGPVMLSNSWTNPIQTGSNSFRDSPVQQITDNVSILRGRHSLKGGVALHFTTQYQISEAGIFPNISFSRANGNTPPAAIGPGGSTISSADRQRFENLYNDLLGRVSSIITTFYGDSEKFQPAGSPRARNFFFHDYGYFFQDDWRIRPNLTLNLGLRWEFFGVPFERDRLQGVVKQASLINPVSQISDVTIQRGANWFGNDWNNFAPRFGFSWDPEGKGKTAIRGTYGIFYDRVIGGNSSDVDGATPGFAQPVSVFPNSAAGSDRRLGAENPTLPAQPTTPAVTPAADRTNSLSLWDPRFRTPYVHQFNLTFQRELFRNTVLEAGFVGNRGVKLLSDLNPNQRKIQGDFMQAFKEIAAFRANGAPVPASNTLARVFGSVANAVSVIGGSAFDQGSAGTAAQTLDVNNYTRYAAAGVSNFYLRNYPQFNTVVLSTNSGRSYYNSLQVSLRRQAGALRFSGNYTWSKTVDNISVDGSGFTRPIDSFNLILNRALADFDRTHSVTWSASYTLPIGRGRLVGGGMPNWLDKLVGGWDLGSLGVWTSGPTMTVTSGRETAAVDANTWANYSGDRRIGSVERQGNGVIFWTPDQIARLSFPGAGEIGSSGRNAFRGPAFFSTDLSVVKHFRLAERHVLTFRAEAYNLLNQVNFAAPGLSLVTPASLGRISATVGNARIMQGALRYDF
ncbi:MAG: TonB-dependent receptor, partial [Candidatus Solibacter usitatus]|nr:TonB-dependent receptor [Candidatus Solibacter usitatus]